MTITPTATFKTSVVAEVNEFKKDLITWTQNQATGKRTQAAIAKTKWAMDGFNAKAESYDFMAKYLQGIEIVEQEQTKQSIKICPNTKQSCEENCGYIDCYLQLSKAGLFDI